MAEVAEVGSNVRRRIVGITAGHSSHGRDRTLTTKSYTTMAEISNVLSGVSGQPIGNIEKLDAFSLEFFDIPLSRRVQGNAFPLGLRLNSDGDSASLEGILKHIEELADRGAFRELLQKRKCL